MDQQQPQQPQEVNYEGAIFTLATLFYYHSARMGQIALDSLDPRFVIVEGSSSAEAVPETEVSNEEVSKLDAQAEAELSAAIEDSEREKKILSGM